MKLYDTEQKCLVEMELNKAPLKILVSSLKFKSLALLCPDARKSPCLEEFQNESHLIEEEILARFENLENQLTITFVNKMTKFYE